MARELDPEQWQKQETDRWRSRPPRAGEDGEWAWASGGDPRSCGLTCTQPTTQGTAVGAVWFMKLSRVHHCIMADWTVISSTVKLGVSTRGHPARAEQARAVARPSLAWPSGSESQAPFTPCHILSQISFNLMFWGPGWCIFTHWKMTVWEKKEVVIFSEMRIPYEVLYTKRGRAAVSQTMLDCQISKIIT